MHSTTATFRKQRTCPSAELLLLHAGAGLSPEQQGLVSGHLAACDFCGTESQLLARHYRAERTVAQQFYEMPLPLRLLAESLMGERAYNSERFVETIYEIERLTLTDA